MEGVHSGGGGGGGRRRLSLREQMSAVDGGGRESLAGLTLDAILGNDKRSGVGAAASPPTTQLTAATAAQMNRTLLDIIRDDDPHRSLFGVGGKDKKSWKAFRERLRLRRAGAAWTSTVHVPASDLPVLNRTSSSIAPRSLMMSRRNSVRFTTVSNSDPQMSRRSSTRYGQSPADRDEFSADTPAVGDGDIQSRNFRPATPQRQSVRNHDEEEEAATAASASHGSRRLGAALAEERALSAREAIAAQEAAEEEEEEEEYEDAGDGEVEDEVGERGMGVSLMDLLEETDRQMGFEGARYVVGEDDEQSHYYGEEDDDGGNEVRHVRDVVVTLESKINRIEEKQSKSMAGINDLLVFAHQTQNGLLEDNNQTSPSSSQISYTSRKALPPAAAPSSSSPTPIESAEVQQTPRRVVVSSASQQSNGISFGNGISGAAELTGPSTPSGIYVSEESNSESSSSSSSRTNGGSSVLQRQSFLSRTFSITSSMLQRPSLK